MSKEARDKAVARVGKALYGSLWVGTLADLEWERAGELGGRDGAPISLPMDVRSAKDAALACFRTHAADIQVGQVLRWLREQGIDCEAARFDADKFNLWFKKAFAAARIPPKEARSIAIRKLLAEGHQPGRGGNIPLKRFCVMVRAECGMHCDNKTVERDLKAIRKAQ